MRGAGGAAGRSGGGKQTEGSGGERRDPAPGAVSGAGPPSPDPARAAAAGPRGAAAKMTVPVSADRRGPRAPRCRPGPPGVAGGSSRVVCGGGNRMGAPPPRRLLRPCSSSLLQDSRGEPGPVLAPPGAPRDGWVGGEGVCGPLQGPWGWRSRRGSALFPDLLPEWPGRPRRGLCHSLEARVQVSRAGRGVGRSVLFPSKLPARAALLCSRIPHPDGQAWGGVCAVPETPSLRNGWLGWLIDRPSLPLPLLYALTWWEVLLNS